MLLCRFTVNAILPSAAAIVALALLAPPALADEASAEPASEEFAGFSLFFENDILFPEQNEDRDYTMGVILQFDGEFVNSRQLNIVHTGLDSLLSVDRLHDRTANGSGSAYSLQVGITAYTPDRIEDPEPIYDDRPYSSLLFGLTRRQTVDEGGNFALTSELSMGVLGLKIAENVQTWIHERMQDFPGDDPQTPRGWDNQISDGGELTARYRLAGQWLISCTREFDLQAHGEGNIGYYTNAGAGLSARFGKIISPWWNFSAAPIKESSLLSSQPTTNPPGKCPSRDLSSKWELYGWAGADVTYWLYNVLLQGQFRESPVTISSSDLERSIGDYKYGLTGGFVSGDLWWNLTYARTRRTAEFKGPNRRSHSWGGIYLSISKSY